MNYEQPYQLSGGPLDGVTGACNTRMPQVMIFFVNGFRFEWVPKYENASSLIKQLTMQSQIEQPDGSNRVLNITEEYEEVNRHRIWAVYHAAPPEPDTDDPFLYRFTGATQDVADLPALLEKARVV